MEGLRSLIDEEKVMKAVRKIIDKVPAVVIKRVKSTGKGVGDKFSPYSDAIIKKGEHKGMRWKDVRSEKGLQTGFKDFWFEGDMWQSYVVIKETVGGGIMRWTLGTTDGKTRRGSAYLSDIHSNKEGQFILDITDDEWEKVSDEIWEEFVKTISV